MNKEERNSHVLSFKHWTVYYVPFCRAIPQRIQEKYGKHRVIFDSSTQTTPDKVVLNQVTQTDHEATFDFGKAKTKLLTNIYNLHVSFPNEVIYLALANTPACFCFLRISADVASTFGFLAGCWSRREYGFPSGVSFVLVRRQFVAQLWFVEYKRLAIGT